MGHLIPIKKMTLDSPTPFLDSLRKCVIFLFCLFNPFIPVVSIIMDAGSDGIKWEMLFKHEILKLESVHLASISSSLLITKMEMTTGYTVANRGKGYDFNKNVYVLYLLHNTFWFT